MVRDAKGILFWEVTSLDNTFRTLNDGSEGYSDQTFSAQFVTDIGVTHNFTDKLALTVGGNNIFNKYPDILRAEERGFYLYPTISKVLTVHIISLD